MPGLSARFFIGRDGMLQSVHMGEISREGLLPGSRNSKPRGRYQQVIRLTLRRVVFLQVAQDRFPQFLAAIGHALFLDHPSPQIVPPRIR